MQCSMYQSIFNCVRATARYWSEIATFSYPLHLTPPSGKVWSWKTIIMGLPGSEDSLTIGWAVSTQYQRVTDRQTDGRTDVQPISITCAVWLTHVKNWYCRSYFDGSSSNKWALMVDSECSDVILMCSNCHRSSGLTRLCHRQILYTQHTLSHRTMYRSSGKLLPLRLWGWVGLSGCSCSSPCTGLVAKYQSRSCLSDVTRHVLEELPLRTSCYNWFKANVFLCSCMA